MKIGILTLFHNNYNYGAHLQAFAILKILKQNGIKGEVIDFDWNAFYKPPQNNRKVFLVKRAALFLRRKLFCVSMKQKFIERKRAFSQFDRLCIESVSETVTVQNIAKLEKSYDGFIVGSDQVWRFINRDPQANAVFLLNFTNKIKMSYSASLGLKKIPENAETLLKKELSKFDYISVREEQSRDILKDFTEKEIAVTLDPTLLISERGWAQYKQPFFNKKKKYIFCYFISESKWFRKTAERYSKEWGMPLYSIPYMSMGYNDSDLFFESKKIYDVSPSQFLSLISEAELVLTDSFHALVFSLLFKRKCQVFLRKENSDGGMSERIVDLLKKSNLQNLLVKNESSKCLKKDVEISYLEFEQYINDQRNKSLDFLLSIKRRDYE